MTSKSFMFGPWQCRWSEAFYVSPLSIAIVNLKPIVPGHCLVLSKRVTPSFTDLSPEEVADLWHTVHKISGPLQQHFGGEAMTLAIQDGVAAGQTVPHVHVHVIPRRDNDFPRNDQVYDEIDKSDLRRDVKIDADDSRKPRSKEEMYAEALELRTLFPDSTAIPQ